jgi:hypothetical protein
MTIEFIKHEELSALRDCEVLLKAMGEIKALVGKMGGRTVTRAKLGIPSSIRIGNGTVELGFTVSFPVSLLYEYFQQAGDMADRIRKDFAEASAVRGD